MSDFILLVLARWLHFGAAMILFGSSLFRMYSPVFALPNARLSRIAALIVFASALAWVGGSIIAVTGNIASLRDPAMLGSYFFDTQFGRVWLVRFAFLASIAALIFAPEPTFSKSSLRAAALLVASGSLLVSQAWLGHAATASVIGAWPPIVTYATHVLAAGAWLGGLPALAELTAAQIAIEMVDAALRRFSKIGIISVVLILISGLANSVFRTSSITNAMSIAYGQTIALKITLLVPLVGLAAQNRLYALPRLREEMDAPRALRVLKRNILMEQALGATILLAASVLGQLPPLR